MTNKNLDAMNKEEVEEDMRVKVDSKVDEDNDCFLTDEQPRRRVTGFAWLVVTAVALGGFLFGYDTGIVAGSLLPIAQEFSLNHVQQELVVGGTFNVGAIVGAVSAGASTDRFGRKPLTLLSSAMFIIGAAVMAAAQNYEALLAGRFVIGLGVGLASHIVPIYLAELSPKNLRGQLVTMNVLLITGGQLVSYLIATGLTNVQNGWRWMMAIAGVPALLQLFILPFFPESPRFLIKKGNVKLARSALERVYGEEVSERFISTEIKAIEDAVRAEDATTYLDCFRKEGRSLLVACSLQALQQLSGFNTAMYYSATILRMAGFSSNQSATSFSILVAGTNMLMTVVALLILDKVGRRKLLLSTMWGMIVGLAVMGGAFVLISGLIVEQSTCAAYATNCGRCLQDTRCGFSVVTNLCVDKNAGVELYDTCPYTSSVGPWLALVSLVFYVASYAIGLGNIPWLVQSELFPLGIRGKASSFATATNWVCNLIINVTFLTLTLRITASGTFWLYAGIVSLFWVFLYFIMPETSGKSLEEMKQLRK
ncbi:uncharacterized protein VTP21DRAFT_1291 [Calcarisporiella thermophila]|uniref:uncharacterized protein n=1 Tax=Calcarisporiella thermophila TaxID=911321 RepID=UPI0037431211